MLQWLVVLGFVDFGLSRYTGVILSIWILAAAKFSDVARMFLVRHLADTKWPRP